MAVAAPVAVAASVASLGMSAAGKVMSAEGTKAADEFQAAKLERAAQIGEAQYAATDVTMREHLNTTLANIDAIRAAGNVDPTSPSSGAIEDFQRTISGRQRLSELGNIKNQINEDNASADYLHQAGDFAMTQGYLSAATSIAGGVGKGLTGGGGG